MTLRSSSLRGVCVNVLVYRFQCVSVVIEDSSNQTQVDSPDSAKRSKSRRRLYFVGVVVVVAFGIVIGRSLKVDDDALAQALAGTWIAVDPSDASLHRRELPVSNEQLIIRSDGTLTHVVELASKPGQPENDAWGWKVRKGRLYVRFTGEDATGQWLPGFAFSVSDTRLSIRIKGHPAKQWVRG